jgi:hypothetical protein
MDMDIKKGLSFDAFLKYPKQFNKNRNDNPKDSPVQQKYSYMNFYFINSIFVVLTSRPSVKETKYTPELKFSALKVIE